MGKEKSMLDVIKEQREKKQGKESRSQSPDNRRASRTKGPHELFRSGSLKKTGGLGWYKVKETGDNSRDSTVAVGNVISSGGGAAAASTAMDVSDPEPRFEDDFEDEVDPTPPDVSLDLLIKYQRGDAVTETMVSELPDPFDGTPATQLPEPEAPGAGRPAPRRQEASA